MMKSNKNIVRELAKKQERLLELTKEYLKAKVIESKKYHLIPDEEVNAEHNWVEGYLNKCNSCNQKMPLIEIYHFRDYRYYLIEISTKNVLAYGSKSRIKSFIRLKNIKDEDILNDVHRW